MRPKLLETSTSEHSRIVEQDPNMHHRTIPLILSRRQPTGRACSDHRPFLLVRTISFTSVFLAAFQPPEGTTTIKVHKATNWVIPINTESTAPEIQQEPDPSNEGGQPIDTTSTPTRNPPGVIGNPWKNTSGSLSSPSPKMTSQKRFNPWLCSDNANLLASPQPLGLNCLASANPSCKASL